MSYPTASYPWEESDTFNLIKTKCRRMVLRMSTHPQAMTSERRERLEGTKTVTGSEIAPLRLRREGDNVFGGHLRALRKIFGRRKHQVGIP